VKAPRSRAWPALLAALIMCGCDTGDPTRDQLATLVERRATRAEVEAELGPGLWYGRQGEGGYAPSLKKFLDHEPPSWGTPLRAAVQRGDAILHYNSMWQMTWLFFDGSERVVGYWMTAQ
jgi:hypothetical protein